jgi:hypothetical protein
VSDNGQIVWEDPGPPARGPALAWDSRLRPLMERPGEWARVREAPRSQQGGIISQLKSRRFRYPAGRWEFTTRRIDEARISVYARYLGPEDGGS